MTRRDVGVIIAAGGSGTRAGSQELKQFRWIAGKPMLLHSLQKFQQRPDVAMVVCVLPKPFVADPPPWIFQCDTDRLLLSLGGRERQESVANGLEDIPEGCDVVIVHDAARPFFTDATADAVIAAARAGKCAVPVLPMVDTVKRLDSGDAVIETVDRSGLWRVQTPQGFPRQILEQAHLAARRDGVSALDDAALCERLEFPCIGVPGSERAMKVTTDADFTLAESLSILRE
jgi:2-C-methyl-D-erythritol 4-phosphate cytidylyltransferase